MFAYLVRALADDGEPGHDGKPGHGPPVSFFNRQRLQGCSWPGAVDALRQAWRRGIGFREGWKAGKRHPILYRGGLVTSVDESIGAMQTIVVNVNV